MKLLREFASALATAALIVFALWVVGAMAGVVVVGFRMVVGG